jgi:hypothetical protein
MSVPLWLKERFLPFVAMCGLIARLLSQSFPFICSLRICVRQTDSVVQDHQILHQLAFPRFLVFFFA